MRLKFFLASLGSFWSALDAEDDRVLKSLSSLEDSFLVSLLLVSLVSLVSLSSFGGSGVSFAVWTLSVGTFSVWTLPVLGDWSPLSPFSVLSPFSGVSVFFSVSLLKFIFLVNFLDLPLKSQSTSPLVTPES